MKISQANNQNFKSLSALSKPLGALYNSNATIPTLLIETGVTLGRAHEANKRGGKKEATERLVEQGASAVIWIWGVQALKKIGDLFGEKILGFKNLNFDVGRDNLRNPVVNNNISKKVFSYKVGNTLLSTAIATIFIGFVLPKINHKISSKIKEKDEEKTAKKENKNISFTSKADLAHIIENNSTARLLITDTGVISGRFANGRNKYEKIEGLFRDISSIFFYLFSTPLITKGLSKISKNADISPVVLEKTTQYLNENIGNGLKKDEFIKKFIGKITEADSEKYKYFFEDNCNSIMTTSEFIKIFPHHSEKAKQMAELQPIFEDLGVLTKLQAKDVLSDGLISNPEFLKNVQDSATKGASSDKLKFVAQKDLEKIRKSINSFIEQISNNVKDDEMITSELINKIAKKNINKNFAFYSIALLTSTFALGILIPKVQYLIGKKMTNSNDFPGDKKYD